MLFQSVDRAGGLIARPLTRRARVVLAMASAGRRPWVCSACGSVATLRLMYSEPLFGVEAPGG